jgi:hypothetical protein
MGETTEILLEISVNSIKRKIYAPFTLYVEVK